MKRVLQAKFGFAASQVRSDDHEWFELVIAGCPKIATKFSHGDRDIGDPLQVAIARQLRVTKPYLDGMLDCSRSCDDYRKVVVDSPVGPLAARSIKPKAR